MNLLTTYAGEVHFMISVLARTAEGSRFHWLRWLELADGHLASS